MARNIREPIPLPVILAASEGDERALNAVLNHYKGYIRFLAMRPMKDEYGNEHLYVDEDMRLRLEAKLLYSIVTRFQGSAGLRYILQACFVLSFLAWYLNRIGAINAP